MKLGWIAGVAVAVFGALACGAQDDETEELIAADENIATASDELAGNVSVGTQVRTTANLNLRSAATTSSRVQVVIPQGATVTIQRAAPQNSFYSVKYGNRTGWAHGSYLTTGSSSSSGSSNSGGGGNVRIGGPRVRSHVQGFANAACSRFGCPYELGTRNGHSPTADRAVDIMMARYQTRASGANKTRGDNIANFGVSNGGNHKVMYVIWFQRINSRDGRGWRRMSDRGSNTQNHYDHVHVSFNP